MSIQAILALFLLGLLSGCNAMCFASMDPDIWGQGGDPTANPPIPPDDMEHLAWYGNAACSMGDYLP
jgi:hypothetical protein